jgi:hypothetical protein
MDRGSSLNIIYLKTLNLLGIERAQLQSSAGGFHGVVLGKKALHVGRIDLPVYFGIAVLRIYSALGRYKDAADLLAPIISPNIPPATISAATRFLRSAPASPGAPETLPRLGILGFVYLHIGAPERALDFYEDTADMVGGGFSDTSVIWHPSFAAMRKLERFKAYVQQVGLVDYWRERGWPAFCRPTTGDDFVCE